MFLSIGLAFAPDPNDSQVVSIAGALFEERREILTVSNSLHQCSCQIRVPPGVGINSQRWSSPRVLVMTVYIVNDVDQVSLQQVEETRCGLAAGFGALKEKLTFRDPLIGCHKGINRRLDGDSLNVWYQRPQSLTSCVVKSERNPSIRLLKCGRLG